MNDNQEANRRVAEKTIAHNSKKSKKETTRLHSCNYVDEAYTKFKIRYQKTSIASFQL